MKGKYHTLQKDVPVLAFELLLFYVVFWLSDSPLEPCQVHLAWPSDYTIYVLHSLRVFM